MLGSRAGYHRSADSTASQHSSLELSYVSCDGNVATHRFLVPIELQGASECACQLAVSRIDLSGSLSSYSGSPPTQKKFASSFSTNRFGPAT